MKQAVDPQTNRPQAKFVYSVTELEALLAQPADQRPIAMIHCIEGGHSIGVADPARYSGVSTAAGPPAQPGGAFPARHRLYGPGALLQERPDAPLLPLAGEHPEIWLLSRRARPDAGADPQGRGGGREDGGARHAGGCLALHAAGPQASVRHYRQARPILASHVGAYAINPDPYNLQDWELRRIAESGGVTGVIFMNYWLMPHETGRGLNFIVHHIRHMIDTAGSEHVGIGTDFDGFTDPPDDLRDASELPRLTQRLLAEGFNLETLTRLWGGNALRALRQGWGKRTLKAGSAQGMHLPQRRYPMPQFNEIQQARAQHEATLMRKPNVVGVGVSYKSVAGESSGELCMAVLVQQKLPKAGLSAEALVPAGAGRRAHGCDPGGRAAGTASAHRPLAPGARRHQPGALPDHGRHLWLHRARQDLRGAADPLQQPRAGQQQQRQPRRPHPAARAGRRRAGCPGHPGAPGALRPHPIQRRAGIVQHRRQRSRHGQRPGAPARLQPPAADHPRQPAGRQPGGCRRGPPDQ